MCKNGFVTVKYNGAVISKKKKARLAPGEMESVVIKKSELEKFEVDGILEISAEGENE